MSVKKFFLGIKEKISQMETIDLSTLLLASGMGLLIIYAFLGIPESKALMVLELSSVLFVWGLTGFVYITRKEIPSIIFIVRGNIAVVCGFLIIILTWGSMVAIIFSIK